jgi:hypothetical protein
MSARLRILAGAVVDSTRNGRLRVPAIILDLLAVGLIRRRCPSAAPGSSPIAHKTPEVLYGEIGANGWTDIRTRDLLSELDLLGRTADA